MGLIAPSVYIAPSATDPHRFGLFSVANVAESPERWELGVEWEPIESGRAELRAHECVDVYTADIVPEPGVDRAEALPFIVVGTYDCKSASRPITEAEERARLALTAGEERAVEYAIATGAMGNTPTFQGADDLTPAGGAVSLDDGLALIEATLGSDYQSVGTVHAPRLLGPPLGRYRLVERQGQRLETLTGTYVAVGGGYDLANVGPDGTTPDAGTAWLYGTGRPTMRMSDVFVQPDEAHYLDKATNDVVILAQRAYLIAWDGPTVAVLVDAAGGGGS